MRAYNLWPEFRVSDLGDLASPISSPKWKLEWGGESRDKSIQAGAGLGAEGRLQFWWSIASVLSHSL